MSQQEELEKLKKQQEYALQLEEAKWKYKQQELAYVEAGNHMRALNLLMWQVPSIAIAVTGGLWYGAASLPVIKAKVWVFAFAAFVDCMTIITLWRLRSLIGVEIVKQEQLESLVYNPMVKADTSAWVLKIASCFFGEKNIVVKCWSLSLFAAAIVSILGAANTDEFRTTAPASQVNQQTVPEQQPLKTLIPARNLAPNKSSQDSIKTKQPEVHTKKSASDPLTPPLASKRPS